MKKILILGVMLCLLVAARAQKVYFVYLQSDNNTAFYLKTGDKIYSSAAEGYLIVPKLVDSTYHFIIGKAGQQPAESRFTVTINKGDRGFLLRQTDNSLSLFDLQTLAVINPSTADNTGGTSYIKKTDGFTTLLSRAADDTTLLNVPVAAKMEKPKKEQPPVQTVAKAETAIADNTTAVEEAKVNKDEVTAAPSDTTEKTAIAEAPKTDSSTVEKEQPTEATSPKEQRKTDEKAPESTAPAYTRSSITRYSESSTSDGFGLVFLDKTAGDIDTVRLLIPNQKIMFEEPVAPPAAESKPQQAAATKKTTDTTAVVAKKVEYRPKADCRRVAGEKDFIKLRRYMVIQPSEETMIEAAKKYFKTTCYSTQQLKSLGALFLTPKGKYNFFDTAYTHVSDPEQFPSLQSELWDDYYINRFKALIGK